MDLHVLTFVLVLLSVGVLPRTTERRAVSSHKVSPQDDPDRRNITKGDSSERSFVKVCPPGQIRHKDNNNNTVCCLPTACQPGQYIVRCNRDGQEDWCKKCDTGSIQPSYVASDDTINATCFLYNERKHRNCAKGDTREHSGQYLEKCPMWCLCDTSRCFHGDPCHCGTIKSCGINEEMDPDTNSCRPCPRYAFKNVTGCQRCEINVTQWRLGTYENDAVIQVVTKKTSLTTNTTASQIPQTHIEKDVSPLPALSETTTSKNSSGKEWHVVVIVLAALVVGLVAGLVLLAVIRNRDPNTQSSLSHRFSAILSKCLPQKINRQTNTDSTMTTPDSEDTSLLDYDDKTTSPVITDRLKMLSENTEPKYVKSRHTESSLEEVYNRTAGAQSETQRKIPLVSQISVAEVHSSDNSCNTSGSGSSPDLYTEVEEGVVLANTGVVAGPKIPATVHKEVPAQGRSLHGVSLVRGQNQESDVDTGIGYSVGPSAINPEESGVIPGEVMDDDTSRHSSTDIDPELLGSREVVGQSMPTPGQNLAPLKMPSNETGRTISTTSTSSPVTPSARKIDLPTSPNEFTNRIVATVLPFHAGPPSGVHETEYHYSRYSHPGNMADSSQSVSSYFQVGNPSGSLDIGNQSDFSGETGLDSTPLPQDRAVFSPGTFLNARCDPDGASGQCPPRGVLIDEREQTNVKEVAPSAIYTGETVPKYVDTDNTAPKTIQTWNDSGKINHEQVKSKPRKKGYGVEREGDEITEVTEKSSSVPGGNKGSVRTHDDSPVFEGEDAAILMDRLKSSDNADSAHEIRSESDSQDFDNNICDSSVEIPNEIDMMEETDPGESLELPNDVLEHSERSDDRRVQEKRK